MNSVWQGVCASPSTSAASYLKVNNSLSSATATGQNNFNQVTAICPISDNIIITGITVWSATAPAGAASWTLAVQTSTNVTTNATGTFTTSSASVTLSGSNTTASWSGTASIAQSSFINMILTPAGTPAASANVYWAITYTTAGNFYLIPAPLDGAIQNNASGNYYGLVLGAYAITPTYTASDWGIPVPTNLTVTKIIGYSGQQLTMGGASKTYSIYNVTTSTASSFSSTATGSTTCLGAVGTGSMSFTAGEQICFQAAYANQPGWAPDAVCITVVPNATGEVVNGYVSSAAPSSSAVNYQSTNGGGASAWNATESAVSVRFLAGTIKNLYARVTTAPGGSASYSFALRDTATNSGVTCTVTGVATTASDTTNSKAITDGETVDFQCTPTGTPNGTAGVALSFVQTVTQLPIPASPKFFTMF